MRDRRELREAREKGEDGVRRSVASLNERLESERERVVLCRESVSADRDEKSRCFECRERGESAASLWWCAASLWF